MITDKVPRKAAFKQEYQRSEAMCSLSLPPGQPLRNLCRELEVVMVHEDRREIEKVCNAIADCICEAFNVTPPTVRVLGVRPLEEADDFVDETYGDYHFQSQRIRLWMRTAVLEKMTSYGTLLSTLCHEVCHHLDVVHLEFYHTYHTRGFYERAGILYHHARGTPVRTLVWDQMSNGQWKINWPATMRGSAKAGSLS